MYIVEYISYNMGNRDLPDIYTLAQGPVYISGKSVITYTYNVT